MKIKVILGMTLVEVMVAMVIIMGILIVAYRYHLGMIVSNRELLEYQDALLRDESVLDETQ